MKPATPLRIPLACAAGALFLLGAAPAGAFPQGLFDWQDRYGAISPSGDDAGCQLCHANANGGSPWNAYGWDVVLSLGDLVCDRNLDGSVSNEEAFFCIETPNSDGDGGNLDNVTEIGIGTQPGWTLGPFNTLYTRVGTIPGQLPPDDIGPVDPVGTPPPPPPPPPPPDDDEPLGRPRRLQFVWPGKSIQRAIDRAKPGGLIIVFPGTYRELADPTNALNISKSVRLFGLSSRRRRVVLENAGNQRNGIVVVPDDRTDCMGCHTSLAPPFEVHPGVAPGLKMREPMIRNFMIKGFTIRGFRNNGLFTENVDGFKIIDVESIENKNYGIFPTLSKNGLVTRSYASGADDSGIWVETSENVRVTHNLVEGNVNGFEVSNSDDILLAHNEARDNSIGIANLLLPDIFDDRAGAKRVDMKHNYIHDNNRPNTARPGSILSEVPEGIGILHLGVDDSLIADNWVANNEFVGIGVTDYCLAVAASPGFNCMTDQTISSEFLADQTATNNRVLGNVLMNNGTQPPPGVFGSFAADLTLLGLQPNGNCYAKNVFQTFVSFAGLIPEPPPCEPEAERRGSGRRSGRKR